MPIKILLAHHPRFSYLPTALPQLLREKLPFRHLTTDTSDSMVTGLKAEWLGEKARHTVLLM